VRWVEERAELTYDVDGTPARLVGVCVDVTERREAEEALRESHDRLQAIIDGSPSIIYVKDGDSRYLLANRRLEELRGFAAGDIVGRADEEIFPPAVVERQRADDQRVFASGEVVVHEEVLPAPGGERVYLTQKFPLRRADGSIYAVGAVATDVTERREHEQELRDEVEWSNRVRRALKNELLVLHGQPIVDARSGQVSQQELLVRMHDADEPGELIPPGLFLPAAERSGLITEVDRWVVSQAIGLARERRVEVNLSGRSIGDPSLLELIEREMDATRVDPGMVIFEITETTAVQELEAAREFAGRLKELGCGFALDDFGTGFGSFTYLKHFPVDYLKIDMEFVRDLHGDESNSQLIRAIVGVAQGFGIRTIAEGVEDRATLDSLRELGVDYFQGYLLGRPGPLEDLDVGVVADHEAVRLR
jgi:PAS domain S-box-containing protein